MQEGRQDFQSPRPVTEESDPIHVQQQRGGRMWLGIAAVAVIFLIIIIAIIVGR